jgi:hypothetical protein
VREPLRSLEHRDAHLGEHAPTILHTEKTAGVERPPRTHDLTRRDELQTREVVGVLLGGRRGPIEFIQAHDGLQFGGSNSGPPAWYARLVEARAGPCGCLEAARPHRSASATLEW